MAKTRLIDANALGIDAERSFHDWPVIRGDIDRMINRQPTIDPESLRAKGSWNIRCESHRDNWTGEVDEEFYLECSECKRTVWDIDQMAAMTGEYRKLIEKYPYCPQCGAKMEG